MKVEVAVVGAGSAGAAAAAALAPHAVVALIDRVREPGWRVGESLPGAARRPLAVIGAWERFAAAGHAQAPLKVSRWGSDVPEVLDTFRDPDGTGWRIDRARFEADLRAHAVDLGARLVAPANATAVDRSGEGWLVRLGGGCSIEARVVIDCGGRRSRLLRPHGQRRLVMDRLVCVYQRVPARGEPDPATYVQSVPEGWWYTAALPDGSRLIAFHSDSDLPAVRQVLRRGPAAVAVTVPGLAEATGSADLETAEPPQVCSASSMARSAAGRDWLVAGESAIALDPLSSQGLFNALVTGLEAGQATRMLLDGERTASEEHAHRMRHIWRAYLGHHALYYGMEERWTSMPFWRRRHAVRQRGRR